MILNYRLQQKRKYINLTQAEVARKVQISVTSYQRIEYGSQRPSLDTALNIARVLHCTVEELFMKEG